MEIDVIVEIPKGSRNKYEMDHKLGRIRLDRTLFTATAYPCEYGFVPHTLAEDGDPLDAMVLVDEPTFPGCQIHARPVAAFCMHDEHGPDTKILCVAAEDERKSWLGELTDVPGHLLAEIGHFFDVSKTSSPASKPRSKDGATVRPPNESSRNHVTAPPAEPATTMILLRHGQSRTNADRRFTGWTDVPLTADGDREAHRAGELLREAGIAPDTVHTSVLRRAIRTAQIVLDVLDRPWLPVRRTWRLNERHYGALTSRVKSEVRAEVGDEQYRLWRRSYRQAPPPMSPGEGAALRDDPRYADLPAGTVPDTESLADVHARLLPYWIDTLSADLRAGRTPLVVAHGNSLRALVMHLDGLTEHEVSELNIPTGIPLAYDLDPQLRPYPGGGRYLDHDAATRAAAAVAGEGGG